MFRVHIPRCHHIKTNGTQCGSPALRGRRFCYFHKNWREQHVHLNAKQRANSSITLPVLEDADSIQVALMQVLRLILAGQIDTKMAGLLLYGLQTASLNLRQMKLDPFRKENIIVRPEWVRQTGVGDDAWCEEDFDDESDDEDEEDVDPEESGEDEIDAEDESGNVDDEEESIDDARDQNSLDAGDEDDVDSEADRLKPRVRVARATSRRHDTPKRSRRRCTPDEDDDDAPLDPNAVRALFEMLHLPVGEPEKKPPVSEDLPDADAPRKADLKKQSS